MDPISSPLQACKAIFIQPNRVFSTINDTHNWSWLPFLLVVVLGVLPAYAYFSAVDFQWYVDLLVQTSMGDVSPAEEQAFRNNFNPELMPHISAFMIIFGLLISNAILALYLNICAKSDEHCVSGFTDWYGFSWWVSMPSIINSAIALVFIYFSDGAQLSPSIMTPLSLAYLTGTAMDSQWMTLLQSIRIDGLFSIYLVAVGLSQWTNFSPRKTYIVALAPYLIIWSLWLLFNLL